MFHGHVIIFPTHNEDEQFFVAWIQSHGLIVQVILPDVYLHLYLLQV